MQFVEGQDGQKRREGPWNEEEEARVNEQWKVDRFSLTLKRTSSLTNMIVTAETT